ncbi:MAG: radical SAM protein [Candidatus Bathyarchaeia archaeon]
MNDRKRIKQICLAVTDKCNSRCRHCYVWRTVPRNEFAVEELDRFFQNSNLSTLTSLSVSGGEPILREDIVKVLKTIRRWYDKDLILQSNCFLPDRLMDVVMQVKDITVCCSLDGIGDIHSRIRGVPNAFDKVMKTMKCLKDNSIPFIISMTIQKDNQDQIVNVYNVAKKLGVPLWCRPAGTGQLFNKYTQESIDNLAVIQQLNIIKSINPVWIHINQMYLKYGRLPFPCSAGETSCHISPNFDVFPCSHCPIEWKLGNLRMVDYCLDRLLTSKYSNRCRKCINEIAHPAEIPRWMYYKCYLRYDIRNKYRPFLREAIKHPTKAVRELHHICEHSIRGV